KGGPAAGRGRKETDAARELARRSKRLHDQRTLPEIEPGQTLARYAEPETPGRSSGLEESMDVGGDRLRGRLRSLPRRQSAGPAANGPRESDATGLPPPT